MAKKFISGKKNLLPLYEKTNQKKIGDFAMLPNGHIMVFMGDFLLESEPQESLLHQLVADEKQKDIPF